MSRFWRIAIRTVAIIFAIMIVATSTLVWRLSNSPMTTTFLTPYIASGISRYMPGTHTEIAHTLLSWNNIEHSVTFHADDLRVYDKAGATIADVPRIDIELSVFGLMFGQFLPLALTVDQPHFKLDRDTDGVIRFGGISGGDGDKGDSGDIKGTIARVADNLAHALVTRRLQIMGTVFDVEDQSDKSTWSVRIPEISLERVSGELTGHLAVNVTQKDQTSTLDVHYGYDRQKGLHNLDTTLSDITPSFFAGGHPATLGLGPASIFDLPLSGAISISFDSELDVDVAAADIQGHDGRINFKDFWDQPREVKEIKLKVLYDRRKGLDVPVADIDFGGPKLAITAIGTPALVPTHDLDFELSAQIDNWPMDQYGALWPKPIIANAREWIAANMSKGNFNHGEATFKGELSWSHLADLAVTEGKGKITASGARVAYMSGMPPLEGVGAVATFDLDQMTVQITGGGIDTLRLLPFTLQMTDFEKPVQNIDIPLQLTGTIPDIMKFIDSPRLQYAKAVGLTPEDVNGTAKGTVALHFPLLNDLLMKDVDIKADINLTNVASSKLVKGIDITQGNLALALDKTSFEIVGPAVLNKVPVQINWHQNFNEEAGKPLRQASVKGFIADDQWTALGLDALSGTHGAVPVTLDLLQPDKSKTILNGKLDMTAAEVHVDQLNWKKPSNTPAVLKFTAEMADGQNTQITSINLEGSQVKVAGSATLNPDGHLKLLKLDPFMIGRTNAALRYSESEDEDHTLRYDADGASLDVSGLKGGKEPAHSDPRPKAYYVKLDKLYTSDSGFIANAQGHAIRDPAGWLEISLQGMADGGHKLNVDLAAKSGKRYFSITCDDFGKALKGMGFTDTVNSGKLDIHGESTVEKPRVIEGYARIGSFTVKNLPVLAVLLNATSPFGFGGLLTDSADFNSLRGKFTWQGDEVELKEVRVAGTSVGMNIDGKVDMNSGNANLYGTLVPFSMVNRVLGSIPIIGDIITGGDGGGVLAVAYTIKGPLAKPDVSVNPVSLLTPGFLRNLFFGGGDDSDEDSTPAEAPKPKEVMPPAITNFNKKK